MKRKQISVECLLALLGLAAINPTYAACVTNSTTITCSDSNSSQTISNGISLFELVDGASLSGNIFHNPASSSTIININGTLNGTAYLGSNTTLNFNQSSIAALSFNYPGAVTTTGNTINIAAAATINSGGNTIVTFGNNNVLNVYGRVVGSGTAIITDDNGRGGLTSNTTVNLFPGSSVYGGLLPLQPVGEESFRLNANGSTLTSQHPNLPAIRILGGGPFATSNNGIYYLNDTTLVSQLGGIRLAPQVADTTNNNQFILTGNTRIDSGKYAIIVDGGTGNTFDIKGNTILQGNGGAAINSNGAFDTFQGTSPSIMASDVNTYILRGNAQITGVTGTAFLGGIGQDIIEIAENAQVHGNIITGDGNDQFTLRGGHLYGLLDMGNGDDKAMLIGQNDDSISDIPSLNGGAGNDTLTLDSSSFNHSAKFLDWETVNLTNNTHLTLDGDLILGDAGTQTGTLNIDGSSTLNVGGEINPIIRSAIAGQMTQVNNSGQIDLTHGSAGPGNILTIAGHYTGDNGTVILNTYLGDDNSVTDKLVINGDSTGSSVLRITNAGGPGQMTQADGIQVVQVDGNSAGVFKLGARTTAGLYEYDLFQGGVDANAADGNWYLRSLKTPDNEPVINPESTVYLRNLNAASTMFMHTLHDRLGEPQFTDPYKTEDNNPSSAWVRVVSNHTDSVGGNGQVDLNTDTSLVHLGTDIARWSSDGNDRWLFGVMGAYGQSKIDASAKYFAVTPSGFERNATGKVDGYSVGAYATWYGNKDKPEGAYVDTWAQYGWYDNKVQGNTKVEESYNSSGWTASVEAGYAMVARAESKNRQWIFEPQVQVAYNNYSSNDHTDASGTRITDDNANGVITRVGARLYGRSTQNDNGIQPFVEANWWYSDAKNSLSFNGQTMEDGTPDSRYEVKVGLQGQVAKDWLIWGHAGVQYGSNDFNRYEGMVGIKRVF